MKKEEYKIHIIGAGISGLIAAQVLENHGYSPIVLEASDRAGGRIKTDIIDNYQLDHGFQVLLTAYPAANHYLDFGRLNLQKFFPGAVVFVNKQQKILGDPLRKPELLFATLTSNIGSFSDKIKILKLNTLLKKKPLTNIFQEEEKSTLLYLQEFGFSNDIITKFFKPFFCGIFLEPNLTTSSRMFEFVYKMFGKGYATLPKGGIDMIIKQLVSNLKKTTFQYNTKVSEVKDGFVTIEERIERKSDFSLIATEAHGLVRNLKNQEVEWRQCDTLYFETENKVIQKPLIGLIPDEEALINNIFYHTSLDTITTSKNELLSVTVVKNHSLDQKALIQKVQDELEKYCDINTSRFIKHYPIKQALPKLSNLQGDISHTETKLTNSIFLAGDQMLNGSLNAAIISGEQAALGIIKTLESTSIGD